MDETDDIPLELPLPHRNFAATRATAVLLAVISIVGPLLCISGYAWFDYHRRLSEAFDQVDRLTLVAEEQAATMQALNAEVFARVTELLGEQTPVGISRVESTTHESLSAIVALFPQIANFSIFSSTGQLLASSRIYPVPAVSISGTETLQAASVPGRQPHISLPKPGNVTPGNVFTVSTSWVDSEGRSLGVFSIALRQQYFLNFYRELAGDDPAVLIGLYRSDGGVLVRFGKTRTSSPTAANPEVNQSIVRNPEFGHLLNVSTVDGLERVVAYRRVGGYPLYVTAGIETASIVAKWRANLGAIAAIMLVPCMVVWVLLWMSLRRLREEELAWQNWHSEVSRRVSAEASNRQLRRMGALGNLVANVAHDFNNLLMVVNANVELARRKQYTNLKKEVLAVQHAAKGAQGLARRLMSVARKQPVKLECVDVCNWLETLSDLVETSIGEHVALQLQLAGDTGTVMVDPVELEAAVINLSVNAKDAMPEGGTFTVRCDPLSLADSQFGLPSGDYALLRFTDTGHGMTDAVLRRAFEPLFTTKMKGAGTGLGLAQVMTTCEQAGGTARIVSAPGCGTTISLYLPRLESVEDCEEPTVASVPDAATDLIAPGITVLLVEDNQSVADGIAAVLDVFGCNVRHELTADSAIALLESNYRFDLVLSDVQMPGKLDGLDLAELVRDRWPGQTFALMTGYAQELTRASEAGVVILAKPFDINELRSLVKNCVRT
ncbi:response regulator (plasmid) [Paraburkholderia sprentiae WSM5005]|uniref:histidine kinase n=1 Tax=Paraburkholderia sprentiae WSM5005 TaxID=754502 RepID=A0A1I9YV30_9BURK|nr:hybrid sensor histidine kinase/response regulator [Paraburkholderia sprentiae]APA90072.1 response regulator [Paraburkholderia sprentiae WSM5005]